MKKICMLLCLLCSRSTLSGTKKKNQAQKLIGNTQKTYIFGSNRCAIRSSLTFSFLTAVNNLIMFHATVLFFCKPTFIQALWDDVKAAGIPTYFRSILCVPMQRHGLFLLFIHFHYFANASILCGWLVDLVQFIIYDFSILFRLRCYHSISDLMNTIAIFPQMSNEQENGKSKDSAGEGLVRH